MRRPSPERVVVLIVAIAAAAITPAACADNLIPNSSFEGTEEMVPLGWAWSQGRATGKLTIDQEVSHSGRQSLFITNSTPQAPDVYSCLDTNVPVLPERTYTLSCYVRGENPGRAWIGGGQDWRVRMYLPEGAKDWTRISKTFTTEPGESRFKLLIATDSPTGGFWVDSIQLEEGPMATDYSPPLLPGELRVVVQNGAEAGVGENLIPNASFETVDGNRPKGWNWDKRNTESTFEVTGDAYSGGKAIRIANRTPHGAHVYGQMVLQGGVALTPGETYTLSLYAKSDDPGAAWTGGGDGWWMRISLGETGGEWKRFSRTFQARDKDKVFPLMVNTDSPTDGFIVDAIKLEEGDHATPFIDPDDPGHPVKIAMDVPPIVSCASTSLELTAFVHVREGGALPRPAVTILSGDGEPVVEAKAADPLKQGLNRLVLRWAPTPADTHSYEVRIAAGGAQSSARFELFTIHDFRTVQTRARGETDALREAVANVAEGTPTDYQKAALAIAERFLPIAQRKAQVDLIPEAVADADFIAQLCREQAQRLADVTSGKIAPPVVPNPALDGITIRGGNFWVGDEPVMLLGGLGYNELLDEIGTYRDYGFNVIGDDFNAYSAFRMVTSDTEFDEEVIPKLTKSWDALHEMNLAVAYNPTLHYFPEWALSKYVDITGGDPVDRLPDWSGLGRHRGQRTKSYGGFFPFAIDSPNLRRLVSRYYGKLMPAIKDSPVFDVIWLMNEPTYSSRDNHYVELFREYLRNKFGAVEKINAAWDSEFGSIEEIGYPEAAGDPAKFDWLTFHQDQVASWFEWLSAQIRQDYPDAVLSNKPMAWTMLDPERGIDFEREAELWDIPGCDASRNPGDATYSFGWSGATMLFDFQRSVAPEKPLGDHEYHYVHQPNVSSEYVRASYFQSYLHGLRMSQFWVWATGLIGEGESGAGMQHTAWSQPKVAWGTSTSALDLRRLARYVAAFPTKPEVYLYVSRPSLYMDNASHQSALSRAYAAVNGLDTQVGFMTDRMIRKGRLSDCRLLIVPDAKHVERDVRQAVEGYAANGGRIAMIGDGLTLDEYGKPYAATLRIPAGAQDAIGISGAKQLAESLEPVLTAASVNRPVRALTGAGELAWPVECRATTVDGERICYLVGLNKQPVEVHLDGQWKFDRAEDLITGRVIEGHSLTIEPLNVYLLKLEE